MSSILRGTSFVSHRMNELIFSAGLGFQVALKKKRSETTWIGTPSFKINSYYLAGASKL